MADTGAPFCSLVNVASAADGAPLILVSRLAAHTKNILADARVSLMLDERRAGDPLEGARIVLSGSASSLPAFISSPASAASSISSRAIFSRMCPTPARSSPRRPAPWRT